MRVTSEMGAMWVRIVSKMEQQLVCHRLPDVLASIIPFVAY